MNILASLIIYVTDIELESSEWLIRTREEILFVQLDARAYRNDGIREWDV